MAIFYNEEFLGHVQDPFHPESPDRLRGIVQKLKQHGLWKDVITSKTGREENLRLVHHEDYIEFIRTCGECNLTLDTRAHPETYGIASLAVQCTVDAASHSKKHHQPTFALTRPPGHHSGPDYGMGFCYFNNIAIAARQLLKDGDRRIAIVDIDVHHGNGTHDVFASDSEVLYISMHQSGIFPGTGHAEFVGRNDGEGFTANLPLPSGCGDSTFDVAHSLLTKPIIQQYKPDAMLISWGMDTHYREPLASLALSSQGHVRLGAELIKLADGCNSRITFILEGGYDIPALSEVAAGVIGLTVEKDVPLEYTDVLDSSCLGRGAIERTKKALADYWDL